MAEVPLQRQFAGQAQLVRLLLWRVGDSTDVGDCLHVAVESAMLTADDAAFLRACLDAEERMRGQGAPAEGIPGAVASAEGAPGAAALAEGPAGLAIDEPLIARLRRCADKLNRADAA